MAQTIYDHEAHWEQAAEVFRQLQEYVVGEAAQKELHEVEAGLYQRLLALGQLLLRQYVAASGTGYDPDQPLATLDG